MTKFINFFRSLRDSLFPYNAEHYDGMGTPSRRTVGKTSAQEKT